MVLENSIVDVCVKQRPDRNINKHMPDHQNSLYDIWLVVKVREGTGQKTVRTALESQRYGKRSQRDSSCAENSSFATKISADLYFGGSLDLC